MPCAPLVPTRQDAPWVSLQGRLVEVEAYVDHDAVMDSWERLEIGMALLAQTHNLLRQVEVGEEGCGPWFANYLESADVASSVRRGTARIPGLGAYACRAVATRANFLDGGRPLDVTILLSGALLLLRAHGVPSGECLGAQFSFCGASARGMR